jgi:serine/threonine-protein kinase
VDESADTVLDQPKQRLTPTEAIPAVAPAPESDLAKGSSAGSTTTARSPIEALRLDEILRTRRFAAIGLFIMVGGAVSFPFLPGDPTYTKVLYGVLVLAGLGLGWLIYLAGDVDRYNRAPSAIGWFVPALCVTFAVPYFGVFSPAPILLVLGTYFIGLGQSLPLALAVYLACAIVQGTFAALVIAGRIDDPGIITGDYLSERTQIILQVLVQQVVLCTFLTARASRRSSLAALGELERAVRAVAQREALLHEARQDLERALRSGGLGRFTDQTLGSYRLGAVIGRGAMGEVYEAVHVASGEPAAVKLLSNAALGDANRVRRFFREVQALTALDSPNVVRVLEVGDARADLPYLAMERLRGHDLAEVLRRNRVLGHDEVVELVHQVGAGISAAAAAGIVHRDLKPQNLFRHDDTWKVLDFGVAKLLAEGDTLTHGAVVGTPMYMAPEQARGGEVDHRTDLYGLAAIAYRALTGRPPFSGPDVPAVLHQVAYGTPAKPSSLTDVPPAVDEVFAIAMARKPDDRYKTAQHFARALEQALRGR